jgi:hypothetical protein
MVRLDKDDIAFQAALRLNAKVYNAVYKIARDVLQPEDTRSDGAGDGRGQSNTR